MTGAQADSVSVAGDFTIHNGIRFPSTSHPAEDGYQKIWEDEAQDDAVYSATGIVSHGLENYEVLTASRQQLWVDFPPGHYQTILEIGCGYGRVPLLLTRERGVTCDRYLGVDISRNMLELLGRYRQQIGIFPGAFFELYCMSAEQLHLDANSVDLVISSGVFLHMGKQYVLQTLQRIAHALRPGGTIVFDTSFPNRKALASLPVRAYGLFAPFKPNRVKYYYESELMAMLVESGLKQKCPDLVIEPLLDALMPDRIRKVKIPGARRINSLVATPPTSLRGFTATMFSVHSLSKTTSAGKQFVTS